MEGELLCTYESKTALVRVWTGAKTDTKEKRKELFTNAAIGFDKGIQADLSRRNRAGLAGKQ